MYEIRGHLSELLSEIHEGKKFPPLSKKPTNVDNLLYKLFRLQTAKSYFNKVADDFLKELKSEGVFDESETEVGEAVVVAKGRSFMVTLTINKPSVTIDRTKLKNALCKKFKMSQSEAEKFILKECSKVNAPAKKYVAVPTE